MDVYGKKLSIPEWKVLVDERLENPGQEPIYNLNPDDDREFDAIFIGGGGAGRFGAAYMVALGGRPLLIDKYPFLGGSCPHEACVPHHVFSEAAREMDYAQQFSGEYWYPEWDPKNASILEIRDMFMGGRNMGHSIMNFQSKEQLGIEFILDGYATVIDKNTVEVAGQRYTAKNLVLAVGARPVPPDIPGIEMRGVYNWSTILTDLNYEPNRAVIIGGGKTALEYGSFFQAAGIPTTYLTRSPLMGTKSLHHVDEDIRQYVKKMVEYRGSVVVEGAHPVEIIGNGKVSAVRYRDAEGEHEVETDFVFLGTGEKALSGQFSDVLDLEVDEKGRIVIDKHMRTSLPNVYALGDLVDGPMEQFKARKTGCTASMNIMGEDAEYDYSEYPDFLHTTYEVAWTGLSEAEAREKYDNVVVIQMPPKGVNHEDCGLPATDGSMFYAFTRPGLNGIIKSVIDADTRKIVGIHTVGFGNKNSMAYLDWMIKQPDGLTVDQMADVTELFLNDGFPQLHRLRAGHKSLIDL